MFSQKLMSVKTIQVQRNKVAKCQNGNPSGPRRNTFASRSKVYDINTYMPDLPFETIYDIHEMFMSTVPTEATSLLHLYILLSKITT
jgi:hypothetical protein